MKSNSNLFRITGALGVLALLAACFWLTRPSRQSTQPPLPAVSAKATGPTGRPSPAPQPARVKNPSEPQTPSALARPARPRVVSKSPRLELREPVHASGDTNDAPRFPWYKKRPFAVAQESGSFQWTAQDGRDPAVIKHLAHQEFEEQRLLEENEHVVRRQLVYSKTSFDQIGRQMAETGELVPSVMLPHFDGREFEVLIDKASIADDASEGVMIGRLKHDPEIIAVMSYANEAQYFYLIDNNSTRTFGGDPRDAGEFVLREDEPQLQKRDACVSVSLFDVGTPLPPGDQAAPAR